MPSVHFRRVPVRLLLVLTLGVVVSFGGSGEGPAAASSSSPSLAFSRGSVAVVRWPSAVEANDAIGNGVEIVSPCCGQTPPLDIEAQAVAVRSKGFTGVRYAVRWLPEDLEGMVDQTDPHWLDKYLDRMRAEIEVLTRHGLTVVLNFNQGLKADRNVDPLVERWAMVAKRFQDLPPSVYFEIMNEPNYGGGFGPEHAMSADEWNAIVARVIPVIRATNPQRIIVVSSAMWSMPMAIPHLVLPRDEHLIATFHNYFPLQFTHQGSGFPFSAGWIGTTWKGSPEEVAEMKRTMNDAVCWSRRTGVPLFNGEFSSYNAGKYVDQNPMLWNKTMVQLMEAENISWTYFLLHGHLDEATQHISYDSLRDFDAGVWNQPVLDALNQGRTERIEPWANCKVTPPAPPQAVDGSPSDSQVSVTWSAPASNGGSAITAYTVTASPGGKSCVWSSGPLTCTVGGLANGTPYTFTVTAANAVGTSAPSVPSNAVTPTRPPGAFFHPVSPTRILDSRGPVGGWNAKLVAGAPKSLRVTGGTAAVPANARAVVLNVTVTRSTSGSFLTAYPAGSATPTSSNLNFAAGQTIPNLVTVKVGTGGQVDFANAVGSTDVIADIAGYFDDVPADKYNPLTPARILDSRGPTGNWNTPLVAGTPKTLQVRGQGGVPLTADAVIMNVTATGATANSFLTAYPAGSATPTASNLNFAAGQTIPNLVTVKIGTNGQVAFANATGAVDVIADVAGYFDTTTGDRFHPLKPARILDSRGPTGGWNARLTAGTPRTLAVTNQGGVSADATALIANTTVSGSTANGSLSVYPAGAATPATSNLNFAAGQTIPNLVAVKVGAGGQLVFNNAVGATDVIFDIAGYFAAT
jgi:hypothetical protein